MAAEDRRYRFWWDDGKNHPGGDNELYLKGIKKEHLSWLPIEQVPVTEYLSFNNLEQPMLKIYKRVQWRGYSDDKGSILARFLKKHEKEMGYVLIHKDDFHGIIGVGDHEDYYHGGFATIFNARETNWRDHIENLVCPSIPIIMTSLKKQEPSICYWQGCRAFAYDIDSRDIDGCSYDDD